MIVTMRKALGYTEEETGNLTIRKFVYLTKAYVNLGKKKEEEGTIDDLP